MSLFLSVSPLQAGVLFEIFVMDSFSVLRRGAKARVKRSDVRLRLIKMEHIFLRCLCRIKQLLACIAAALMVKGTRSAPKTLQPQ